MTRLSSIFLNTKFLIGLLLAAFFVISLLFRVVFPYDAVFGSDPIRFTSIDAYYQMRLVDIIVHNFPGFTEFDPYFIYPEGIVYNGPYLFNRLIAGVTWLIGLGSPTEATVNIVGVYFPPVLAALTVIPVFVIGRTIFNKWVGVLAAGLIAVLPGEYIGRSILGFTDYHVAETLFSTIAVMFLILAVKTGRERQLSFQHLRKPEPSVLVRPAVYAALAGLFLGTYLVLWLGGLLFVFVFTVYLVLRFILDHLRGKSIEYLGIVTGLMFLVAALLSLPSSPGTYFTVSMIVAFLLPLFLTGVSKVLSGRQIRPFYYPVALVVIGVVFLLLFYVVDAATLNSMAAKFVIFSPKGSSAATTLEMQPFLFPQGDYSALVAWGNFTTSFFLVKGWPVPGFAFISLVVIIWLAVKQRHGDEGKLLLIVWTIIMLVATLSQRRFAYYLVVNIALLSGYLSWQAIWLAGLRKLSNRPAAAPPVNDKRPRSRKQPVLKRETGVTIYHINTVLAIIIVFVLVYLFNIFQAKSVAEKASFAPSYGWQEALVWMRDNTPEPFGDAEDYYRYHEAPEPGKDFEYPETAYGVTSWWDYGYWITRTAHRMPTANPSQAAGPITRVANLFLTQDEPDTYEQIRELDSGYLVIDDAMATSKFWAMVNWAEQDLGQYIEVYYYPYQGEYLPLQLYQPAYYRTLVARLYCFEGKAVASGKPMVISYEENRDAAGNVYRIVTDANEYDSYEAAIAFVEGQTTGKHAIGGINPLVSPIPLEPLQNYEMVYGSDVRFVSQDVSTAEVKVFAYHE